MEPIAEPSSPLLPGKRIPKKTKRSLRNAGSPPSSIQPPPVPSTHTEDIPPEIAEDVTTRSQSLQVPTVQPAVLPTAQVEQVPSAENLLPLVDSSTAPEVDTNSVAVIHSKHYVHSNEKIPRLTKTPTRAQVMNITSNLLAANCPYTFVDVVPVEVIPSLETLLQTRHFLDRELRDECLKWRTWPVARFCQELRLAVPDIAVSRPNSSASFNELIAKLPVHFDLEDPTFELTLDDKLQAICANFPDVTKQMEYTAAKLLISRLPEQPINWQAILFREFGTRKVIIETVSDFRFVWKAQLERLRNQAQDMRDIGWVLVGNENTKHIPDKPIRKRLYSSTSEQAQPVKVKKLDEKLLCTGCGRPNHNVETCRFKGTKFFNSTQTPYKLSTTYAFLRHIYPTATVAPSQHTMDNLPTHRVATTAPSPSSKEKKPHQKGMIIPDSVYFTTITSKNEDTNYLPVAVSHVSQSLEPPRNEIKALLDTGSLAGDFIAQRCVLNLKLESHIITSKRKIVCSGLDNKCYDISNSLALRIFYFCEKLNKIAHIDITAIILDSSPIDLILGRNTIKLHQLFEQVPSQLQLQLIDSASQRLAGLVPDKVKNVCDCISHEGSQPTVEPQKVTFQSHDDLLTATKTQHFLASLVMQTEILSTVVTVAENEIETHESPTFAPWLPASSIQDPLESLHIAGDEDLQSKIRSLCEEYKDIFSNELPSTPASIPPFDMVVDDKMWKTPQNRAPPRPQSTANHADIVKQIKILESQGIIEKSQSSFYSQVLMVPKADGSKRLCVDYRSLNKCTTDASWPIPNISEMFRRIAAQKPKIFGLMDLTQGYHQAPLSQNAKIYTAFILFCGVYQFTRLPFGLKRAPSYFQQTMSTVVLAGLLYFICEIYIDDVNVFASNNDEFISRLRQVFTRFRHHKVYLKAAKCYLGFSELNYLGKIITSEGLKMSNSKVQSVVDFSTPTLSKQLKSFLGMANYFRDFVRNHSTIVKPLHSLLQNYNKTKKIVWTVETLAAFQQIKTEISHCTTMHFLSDTDPITLHTDASDYGIGGYLFQTIDNKEVPVAFVSKSLSLTQLRWSVIQKEAYAIFYCCTFLESLLRDRQFTIRTDHRNLLFIHKNSNPMIIRWLMALSEYSYNIEFISGIENGIADSMSRLCRNTMSDSPVEYSSEEILSANIIEKFKLSRYQYQSIAELHNSKVGHFGVDRTMKRLSDIKKKWQFQRQHVKWFIDHCPCCQKMSMLKIPIHAHGFTTSTYTPMECLNVDFIGPFPDGGYIFVIIDTFTRWVELFHTIDATATSAAKCLFQHFGRFGSPYQLRSDNGPHFIADLIIEFLALVGVEHCLTLAYSKEENAIVERVNKEINRHLRALTYENTSLENYKESLPFVQRILNANYSDRLKISSSQLLFGNMLKLDRGIFLPKEEQTSPVKSLSQYASKLIKMQTNLLQASAKELLRTDNLHQSFTEQFQHKEFTPDSYVLVHYRSGAPPSRLHTFWRGPMRVVSGKNSRYTLVDLVTHQEKVYHTSDMKPFIFDPAITDPLDVARRDHMEYFVETILDMKGDIKRRSSLEFLVKWLNYDEKYNSWTPYSHLRDTQQLHDYLISKDLRRLIPKKFL